MLPLHTSAQDVSVTIDLSTPDVISRFEMGITYTQSNWERGNSTAVARAKALLEEAAVRFHNTHIMGWGVGSPEPSPGSYSWGGLDDRIDFILSVENVIPIITLCTAPGWMKTSGDDWAMNDRVANEYNDEFAELCAAVAQRYTEVDYFQVWNEIKGYWDYHDDFVTMYNVVYDAVKEARPDAQLGGPYSHSDIVDNWLQNNSGAEFINFDTWVEGWPPGGRTEEYQMERTTLFGDIAQEFRAKTDLPIWVSEYYAGGFESDNWDFICANHASCYYHSLRSTTRLGLLWNPEHYLFSNTESSDGGRSTPLYDIVKTFNLYFGPGTQTYSTNSSSPDVEALASREYTLLINKLPVATTVNVNGEQTFNLDGYEVLLIDTPGGSSHVTIPVSGQKQGAVYPQFQPVFSWPLIRYAVQRNKTVFLYDISGALTIVSQNSR
jgi:hypothetical protein